MIDFLLNSVGSIAGGATLRVALKGAIDAIVQIPVRFQAEKLKNQREIINQRILEKQAELDQHIAVQKAETENQARQQEQQLAELKVAKFRNITRDPTKEE